MAFFANLFFSWDELEKISLATTLAGLFFAFADFTNWCIVCKNDQYTAARKLLSETIHSVDKHIEHSKKVIKENDDLINCVGTGFKPDHPFNNVRDYAEEESSLYNTHIDKLKKIKEEFGEMNNIVDKKILPKIERLKNIEASLLIVGFISFFAIIAFGNIYSALLAHASLLTVLSFCVIMLTYFLKDVYVDHDKLEFEKMLQNIKQEDEQFEKILNDTNVANKIEEIKKYIYIIKTGEHMEKKNKTSGENENG